MIYTNKKKYPSFIVEWATHDDYDHNENEISATTLLKPARSFALTKKHPEKLTIDVDDLIASRVGTAIHDSVEKVKLSNCLQEQRLKTEVNRHTISGKFDIIINVDKPIKKLVDVKSTSVWTYVYGSKTDDYIKQLSIYRYLAKKNDIEVADEGVVWFVFTDWSRSKAKTSADYPSSRTALKPIKLMSYEETEEFIKERLAIFDEELQKENQTEMDECTKEELWMPDPTFAVMKEGRKSAVKLFNSKNEAQDFLNNQEQTSKLSIDERQPKAKRCEYCIVRNFCEQAKRLEQQGLLDPQDKE